MRGRLSADLKEEIRRRVDLVELVSEHVSLKKTGRYYKGLCPFHQEKTPSFHVDRDKGLWHCFGCTLGGDSYDFIMRTTNVSFGEAVELLARRAGVRLERTPEESRQASERDRLYRALDAAAGIFREQLLHAQHGEAARDYLLRRGVDVATAERFRLGYATPAWDDLLNALAGKGYPPRLLEQGGIVQQRPSGDGYYDLLRHRLIFPIFDLQERPVAFGGRALDDAQPKYLNTKETAVFSKGRTLYALNWAREAIRQSDTVVIVEGNMDALTCHQFGITNAVASLGTSLTAEQVLALKRFAGRAVLVYDADASGLAAMERAMALFEDAELPVRVVVLPAGDPDGFLRASGPEAFGALLAQALPVFEYQLAMAINRHDPSSVEGRVKIVEELVPAIAGVANPVRQAEYIRMLAERLQVREDALRQRLRAKVQSRRAAAAPELLVASPDLARRKGEHLLVHLMVHEPPLRKQVARHLAVDDFADPQYRALAAVLFRAPEEPAERLRDLIDDDAVQHVLMQLVFEDPPVVEKEKEKVVRGVIEYLAGKKAQRREELSQQLAAALVAGDIEQVQRLEMAYLELIGQGVPSRKGGEEHGKEEAEPHS